MHYCVIQNQPEAMRLLLRSGAAADLPNNNGKTPLSIARERGYKLCEELVRNHKKKDLYLNKKMEQRLPPPPPTCPKFKVAFNKHTIMIN